MQEPTGSSKIWKCTIFYMNDKTGKQAIFWLLLRNWEIKKGKWMFLLSFHENGTMDVEVHYGFPQKRHMGFVLL